MKEIIIHNPQNKFFRVCVPRGHVGSGRTQDIVFYIEAADMSSATKYAMSMPGVKHTRFVTAAKEIDKSEYIVGREISAYTKYIGNLV